MVSDQLRPTWLQRAALPAMIAALTWLAWLNRFIQDDAFISFRYSHNLVRGLGLVWNPGDRVEGYTSFLWTLIMAVPPGTKPASPRPTNARGMMTPIKLWARPVTNVKALQRMAMTPMAFLQRPARWIQALASNPNAVTAAPNFAFELAAGRSVSKDNPLTFHNDWSTHWANEVEFGFER